MLNRVRSAVAHLVSSSGTSSQRSKSPDLPKAISPPPGALETPKSPRTKSGNEIRAPGNEIRAPQKTAETPVSFSRPTFLQLSPGGLRRADDHVGRAVQSPPDTGRRLPWSTGYAE